MAGTKAGGLKARETNMRLHGEDYYKRIGAKGGKNGTTGGFACLERDANGMTGQDRARKYGRVGGLISKRGKAKK